ncbi:MAG: D-cysteine desulfhydrase family protein [Anaerolineales bacterium]|nr:D-cysteine desulfhydrase family protein [Anaerolineales bacterium]
MTKPGSSRSKLEDALEKYPRVVLGQSPTPLEHLRNLSDELGRPIWIKRDDCFGLPPGGNKYRTLEFLLGEALKGGFRRVVTFGAMQSNHARMTAAAGRRLGLETDIFCFERRPDKMRGNMALNRLYGAKIHFVPLGGGGGMRLETANRLVRWLSRLMVGSGYFIPAGGHSWLGCAGYAAAARETDQQARERGIEDALLALAVGTGGTLAGLMVGLKAENSRLDLLGIDVGKLWRSFPESISRVANGLGSRLELTHRFTPPNVPILEGTYVGERYGLPSEAGKAAQKRLARMEGILLDPVYSAKAFAGLLDLIERSALQANQPVIFLHTGGLPGIFAFNHVAWDKGSKI